MSEIEQAVFSLETMPEKFKRVYEAEFGKSNNIRQLLCMNHWIVYRVKTDVVEVLTLRACRQKDMDEDDLPAILPDES
jgi:Txe/YoeB family toxin of Txe-Axe toxin-antitoxin module